MTNRGEKTSAHSSVAHSHPAGGNTHLADISFRTFVDAIADYAIFMLDTSGCVASWNPGAERLKGYTAADILGRHFSCFYTPDAIERKWPDYELEQAAKVGRFEDEGWRVRKDGTMFWANVVITALHDPGGRLSGFAKITRDLSDKRMQDEALRQSEERFKLLVERVRDYAIFMLDTNGNVVTWNEGATQIKGYQADEIIGRHFSAFYPADDRRAGKPERELAIAKREGRALDEGWRVRKDGSMFWASVTITAVYDSRHELRGFAKVTRDMTERKRLEELEQSERRMSEFLATLAHELRNPLAPLRNAVSILQTVASSDAVVAQCSDMAARQVSQLTRLVDDLLDVGRITAGKIDLRAAAVTVREIVERSIEGVLPLTDARSQRIDVALPDEPIQLHGDEARLVQVVQNLLNNASKFSPAGSAIDVRAVVEGRTALIEIADRGCGIAADQLDSVFNLFVQESRNRNPADSGLGIGLTLSRSLVELHGGAITATSDGPDTGSTFRVRLPIARGTQTSASDSAPGAPGDANHTAVRVLIVDDNRDAADSLALLLQMKGHQVNVAYHARDAVGEARSFEPDMVLIDLAMPDVDGYALLRTLKAMSTLHRAKFVALTGFGLAEDRRRTHEAGFDAHLVKPVDLAVLDELLANAAQAS